MSSIISFYKVPILNEYEHPLNIEKEIKKAFDPRVVNITWNTDIEDCKIFSLINEALEKYESRGTFLFGYKCEIVVKQRHVYLIGKPVKKILEVKYDNKAITDYTYESNNISDGHVEINKEFEWSDERKQLKVTYLTGLMLSCNKIPLSIHNKILSDAKEIWHAEQKTKYKISNNSYCYI